MSSRVVDLSDDDEPFPVALKAPATVKVDPTEQRVGGTQELTKPMIAKKRHRLTFARPRRARPKLRDDDTPPEDSESDEEKRRQQRKRLKQLSAEAEVLASCVTPTDSSSASSTSSSAAGKKPVIAIDSSSDSSSDSDIAPEKPSKLDLQRLAQSDPTIRALMEARSRLMRNQQALIASKTAVANTAESTLLSRIPSRRSQPGASQDDGTRAPAKQANARADSSAASSSVPPLPLRQADAAATGSGAGTTTAGGDNASGAQQLEKIKLLFRTEDNGWRKRFQVFTTMPMSKMAEWAEQSLGCSLLLTHNGRQLERERTPAELGLRDGDEVVLLPVQADAEAEAADR